MYKSGKNLSDIKGNNMINWLGGIGFGPGSIKHLISPLQRWIYLRTGGRLGTTISPGRNVLLLTPKGQCLGQARTPPVFYLPGGNSVMNTKSLMVTSSLVLGLAGLFGLFAPENVLAMLGVSKVNPLSVLIQLLGALYFSIALMNWTAKDSAIGGIYARPVSLGNFAHFFIGMLLFAKYLLSNGFNLYVLLMVVVYAILALSFYWLVFRHTGIVVDKNAPS